MNDGEKPHRLTVDHETWTLMQKMYAEMGLDGRPQLLRLLVWRGATRLWNCSMDEVAATVLGRPDGA